MSFVLRSRLRVLLTTGFAAAIFGMLTSASAGNTGFVCPKKDIIETKCQGPKDCLYPNPKNCTTFIHCSVNADGKSGTPHVKSCPKGLHWNTRTRSCDLPAAAKCSRK